MEHVVPREQWLYNDRGMMKWMGWLLSDHSAYMDSQRRDNQRHNYVAEQMDLTVINQVLQQSWTTSQAVEIQLNILDNSQFVPMITGIVGGFDEGRIYLEQSDGQIVVLEVEQIRNVTMSSKQKWWLNDYHAF